MVQLARAQRQPPGRLEEPRQRGPVVGVVVEEVNYLHRIEDLRLIPGAAAAISRANTRSIPVVMVTNQSGIGRGHYDWVAFAKLQEELLRQMEQEGAMVNMVLACGYHKDALPNYQIKNHLWRKPNPGMLNATPFKY